MSWENIVSVGVVSAVVALIANVIVTIMNNHQLRKMNKDRFNNELVQYRYTKLHYILEDIGKEHGFENHADTWKTFGDSLRKSDRFYELYILAKPLIGIELREALDLVASDMRSKHLIIKESWLRKNFDNITKEASEWASVLNSFHDELTEAIQKQISEFTDIRTK